MPPPHPFAPDTYAAWHKTQFPADDPLPEKVEQLRAALVAGSRKDLIALAQILAYTVTYSSNEYLHARKTSTDYQASLDDALTVKPASPAYDLLFKSTASIINKLWRKNNKDTPDIHLANIREHITDLVRTDVSASTLDSAAFLAEHLNALPGIIYEDRIRKTYTDSITSIEFAPEMKMESAYFAYHGLVRFKRGLIVEVQIYSELMRQWRKLSHSLYERARVEGIQKHEFNSKESRLVSLGHMLHLAECQLQQLSKDFGGQ